MSIVGKITERGSVVGLRITRRSRDLTRTHTAFRQEAQHA